jgi:ribonucleotide reductase alpha subunit
MAAARGPFICQSQSLNLYQENPRFDRMSSMHFHAWKMGLKTGQYYFRSRPARDAIKFTVDVADLLKASASGDTNNIIEALNTTQNKKSRPSRDARKKASL